MYKWRVQRISLRSERSQFVRSPSVQWGEFLKFGGINFLCREKKAHFLLRVIYTWKRGLLNMLEPTYLDIYGLRNWSKHIIFFFHIHVCMYGIGLVAAAQDMVVVDVPMYVYSSEIFYFKLYHSFWIYCYFDRRNPKKHDALAFLDYQVTQRNGKYWTFSPNMVKLNEWMWFTMPR